MICLYLNQHWISPMVPHDNYFHLECIEMTLIARLMGPTWGPSGPCRPQMGPMLALWTLLSGSSSSRSCWWEMKSTLVLVMIVINTNQYWPRFMLPHKVTRSQQVNLLYPKKYIYIFNFKHDIASHLINISQQFINQGFTVIQYRFRQQLGIDHPPRHCLNQHWQIFLAHCRVMPLIRWHPYIQDMKSPDDYHWIYIYQIL